MADELKGFGKFVRVKQEPHKSDYYDATVLLIEKIVGRYQIGTIEPNQWESICRMIFCPGTRAEVVKVMKETAQIYNDAVRHNQVSMDTQLYVERQLRVYKDFIVAVCKHAKENGVIAEYAKENKHASTKLEDLNYYKYIVRNKKVEEIIDNEQQL